MMRLKSKHALLDRVRPRYLKATKPEQQTILDELITRSGYHM